MWPFRKKMTLEESGFFRGFTDWHSHILPGVDDGVQTMEEALRILAEYERLGVKEVWLTPHIMEDMPNTTEHLRERFAELQANYEGNVKLHLAAENMLDNLFEERLHKNDLLPIGKNGKYLLVETSYFNPPMGLNNILLRIKTKGYIPVLAHPERYMYMTENDYTRLKGMGVRFQLNLFSLSGTYGPETGKKAVWMLKSDFCGLIGSDIHNPIDFERIISKRFIWENVLQMLQGISP
ncbi:CpsB/CapC family capsule biosynthesis tyrosine phosphatase [uncultured Parabacteroides sp.]|uniref:tyrosine-protein phosphatase n=1 Tax=uncultured Parabacteroides sp. TaxID=512312 RepID=UPI002637527B|nr:CpsB/CapC family capsule biosynthesis tyrosine phosphatase [uncultured Parabacteroides sp.]